MLIMWKLDSFFFFSFPILNVDKDHMFDIVMIHCHICIEEAEMLVLYPKCGSY